MEVAVEMKTHILYSSTFFPKNRAVFEIRVKTTKFVVTFPP